MILKVAGEQATIELEAEAVFKTDDEWQIYGADHPGTLTLLLPDGEEVSVRGKKLHEKPRRRQRRIQQRT